MTVALLEVRQLSITFGGLHAVDDLSFEVLPHKVVSLIGPNGAGKTTVLNCIGGFVSAHGSVRFAGTEILSLAAHRRAAMGIGRTFQNLQLFGSMTLLENVLVGQHAVLGGNVLFDMVHFPIAGQERRARDHAMEVLRQLHLEDHAFRRADDLPFGAQKLAGVARALSAKPRLLLLDEPAAGLNRQEAETLGQVLVSLPTELGMTILLIEHNMRLVMAISDWVVVLNEGRKLSEGSPDRIGADPAVIRAYLGEAPDEDVVSEVQHELSQGP